MGVGDKVGTCDGEALGRANGPVEGIGVGNPVKAMLVGVAEGTDVGILVGAVGAAVGLGDGAAVQQ